MNRSARSVAVGFIAFVGCMLPSCVKSGDDAAAIVREWMGKEIVVPENLTFVLQGDTVNYNWQSADYRIVTYIDGEGCTECSMKLPIWQQMIDRFNSLGETDVSFLMIVETDSAGYDKVIELERKNKFSQPIVIDVNGLFSKSNSLSQELAYQTFLLDSDNRVVAIGNPVYNHNVSSLYEDIIRGSESIGMTDSVRSLVGSPILCRNIGMTHKGKTSKIYFEITNYSDQDIIIDRIATSCECTEAYSDNDTIQSKQSVTLFVNYTPDSVTEGEFEREIMVNFKGIEEPLVYRIIGFVK